MSPQRIQRKRTAGWRMPPNTVYVGRPSKWGNPFTIAAAMEVGYVDFTIEDARRLVVDSFASVMRAGRKSQWWFANGADRFDWMIANIGALAGKNLACWCPLEDDQGNRVPCHADTLLSIANGGEA